MSQTKADELSARREISPYLIALLLIGVALACYLLSEPNVFLQYNDSDVSKLVISINGTQKGDLDIEKAVTSFLQLRDRNSFFRGALKHVALAFFVAALLIIFVDSQAKRSAREDLRSHLKKVTENVFTGVAQRLVGAATADEIAAILRVDFIKTKCFYQVTLEKLDADRILTTVESTYWVRNTGGRHATFPFEVQIDGTQRHRTKIGSEIIELPRFDFVEIKGRNIPLEELIDPENKFRIYKPVSLAPDEEVKINFSVQLAYRFEHTEVLYSDYVVERSSLSFKNLAEEHVRLCTASVLHPGRQNLAVLGTGQWTFERPLLPGQGWYVEWQPVEPRESPTPS